MKIYKKATLPKGFLANAVVSGIKRQERLDLALFYSCSPAKASAQFTTNKIQAAPIKINQGYLKANQRFQGIIVNSGNANCFTGIAGFRDAQQMTQYTADYLGIAQDSVLVASTGIIGRRLPIEKIKKAIPNLVKGISKQGIDKAKKAIMTTDNFTKEIRVKFNIGESEVNICGVAKGAGMIAPCMATLLCFIFTDANISQTALNRALKIAVDKSFNCITVDGCMSTNDTIIVLANGEAGNNLINTNNYFDLFIKGLNLITLELAKMVVKDAEGATKFIRIKVDKAKNFREAKSIALSIANSNLFKTAIYGENPNFGRIVASAGASGIDIKEEDLKIKVSALNKREINVDVSVGDGNAKATVYTSDLTPEYIKINAEYN